MEDSENEWVWCWNERRYAWSMKSGYGDGCEDIWIQWRGEALVSGYARLWIVIEGAKGEGKWDL